MAPHRASFAFDALHRLAARPFGVTPDNSFVEIDDERVVARFGPWLVETPRDNLRGAGVTGPYSFAKTAGPAHVSAVDRGLTFATNGRAGACLTFRIPVRGLDPLGLVRHPGLTVTVEDPEGLVGWLTSGPVVRTDIDRLEDEQHVVDELHTMTASELRAVADEIGVAHTSSMSKRELVDLIERRAGDRLGELVDEER